MFCHCSHCEKIFQTSKKSRYCSPACKQKAYRKRKNPNTNTRASLKERGRKSVETKRMNVVDFTCKECGQSRKLDQLTAINRDYCSPACKQKAYRKRKSAVTGK